MYRERVGLPLVLLAGAVSFSALFFLIGCDDDAPSNAPPDASLDSDRPDTRVGRADGAIVVDARAQLDARAQIDGSAATGDAGNDGFKPTPITGPIADIPDNFTTSDYLTAEEKPESSAHEPSGNFRTFCSFSHLNYDDPIVFPGVPDVSHLHMFFGNTDANAFSNYQSLRTTGGSTCQGGDENAGLNRTGYWMPAMIDGSDPNDPKVVVPLRFLIYYKGGGTQEEIRAIRDFPNGLRMIAGAGSGSQPDQHQWYCGNNQTKRLTIPTECDTDDIIIGVVPFPRCWDGRNLDSDDHRSHMAFLERDPNSGETFCPSTHPVVVPTLTEFVHYVPDGTEANWYLSSDGAGTETPGASFHADWYGAWSNAAQTAYRSECINGMLNCNSGILGDGTQLIQEPEYSGPSRVAIPSK